MDLRKYVFGILCVVGVGACGDGSVDAVGDLAPRIGDTSWTTDLASDVEFIAEKAGPGLCPKPVDFSVKKVFGAAPGPLSRFCHYTYTGAPEDQADRVGDLLDHSAFARINPTYLAVTPEASEIDVLSAAVLNDLRALTEWRYHAIDPAELAGGTGSLASVHVMVVDTEPPGPISGRSSHGASMARFVEAAACPAGPAGCTVTVHPVLTLMRLGDDSKDPINGGYLARIYELAQGIYQAAVQCQAYGSRCVINVSTGVDTQLFDDAPASGRALHQALRYASCTGAVVIASSGNDGGYGTTGALAPASREDLPAMLPGTSSGECEGDFGFNPPPDSAAYQPLLHGIGGEGTWDGSSAVTRTGSLPRLIAPSSHAVAQGGIRVRSGTSVSAAITSGTVALLLSYDPTLSKAGVMQRLYDTGGNTPGWMAESHLPGEAQAVRRVFACDALEATCAGNNPACDGVALDCSPQAPPVTAAEIMAKLAAVSTTPSTDEVIVFDPAGQVECLALDGEMVPTTPRKGQTDVCSETEPDPLAPYVEPQPSPHACSSCGFDNGSIGTSSYVWASLDYEFWAMTATDATLILHDDKGDPHVYPLGPIRIVPDEKSTAELPPDTVFPEIIDRAMLTITFEGGHVTHDELLME